MKLHQKLLTMCCVVTPLAIEMSCTIGTASPVTTASVTATAITNTPVANIGTSVGDVPPNFSISDLNGNTVSEKELLAQGKPILLFFFATW